MDNTKIENAVQELANIQSQCQELIDRIREIEKEIKQDEETMERVKKGEDYFMVIIDYVHGEAIADNMHEEYDYVDDSRFDNNNYFKTRERTQEVADKVNFLLKLERLHDTFCPDEGGKYYISQNTESGRYCYGYIRNVPITFPISVMFPSEEIAQKVCDILNKECENNEGVIIHEQNNT